MTREHDPGALAATSAAAPPRPGHRAAGLLIGLAIIGLSLLVARTTFVRTVELEAFDAMARLRGERSLTDRLVVIAVDEPTLKALGYPVGRDFQAQLLAMLDELGARAVAYDIVFTDPDARAASADALFAAVVERHGRACLGAVFTEWSWSGDRATLPLPGTAGASGASFARAPEAFAVEVPVPPLLAAAHGAGHVHVSAGPDGTYRDVPLYVRYAGRAVPSLGLCLAATWLGLPLGGAEVRGGHVSLGAAGARRIRAPVDARLAMAVDYKAVRFGAEDGAAASAYSFIELLRAWRTHKETGAPFPWREAFRDRAVLIGQTALAAGDHGATPLDPISPLLMVHANVFDNLVTGRHLRWAPPIVNDLVLVAVGLAACAAALRLRIRRAAITLLATVLCVPAGAYALYAWTGYGVASATPLACALGVFLTVGLHGHYVRDADYRLVEEAFGRFVSPQVLEQLLRDPSRLAVHGRRRRLTILLSDVAGFTRMTNTIGMDEVFAFLEEYLDAMTGILFANGGTLDKVMGDGVLAFFGDPVPYDDGPARAVRTAIEMQARVAAMSAVRVAAGRPAIAIRIGIATGEVLVGHVGSRHKLEYTVIGPAVNLASRLEHAAPPGGILVCAATRAALGGEVRSYTFGETEVIDLKGFGDMKTYEVVA
jgi:adenylate cyclase